MIWRKAARHAGVCYADGGHHLSVAGTEIHLLRPEADQGRTVDRLFQSAAAVGGPRVVGVVLPGASCDGAAGLAAVTRAGGAGFVIGGTLTEGEGMPRAAPGARAASSPEALATAVAATERRGVRLGAS